MQYVPLGLVHVCEPLTRRLHPLIVLRCLRCRLRRLAQPVAVRQRPLHGTETDVLHVGLQDAHGPLGRGKLVVPVDLPALAGAACSCPEPSRHAVAELAGERVADGKTWTGREVCFWTDTGSGAYHRFYALVRRDGRWYVEDTCGIRYAAESVWFERPDSFERIANELDEMVDGPGPADDVCEMLAGIADRIRKLAAKEDQR